MRGRHSTKAFILRVHEDLIRAYRIHLIDTVARYP